MRFIGATIIAGTIYFLLGFLSSLWIEDQAPTRALLEALIKTAVFALLFHYAHNWIARLLGWYRKGELTPGHGYDDKTGRG